MGSFEKFDGTHLPEKLAFYSSIDERGISEADYDHAQSVWRTFQISTLGAYHDLYMETNVILLTDVFENFVFTDWTLHTFILPLQAALKMTGVNLDLLTDSDMHLFNERGLRGGVSMISQRYAKAKNPYVDDYSPNQPSNYLIYLEANNLYGWSMSQALPTQGFRWLSRQEIDSYDFFSRRRKHRTGLYFICRH